MPRAGGARSWSNGGTGLRRASPSGAPERVKLLPLSGSTVPSVEEHIEKQLVHLMIHPWLKMCSVKEDVAPGQLEQQLRDERRHERQQLGIDLVRCF